MKIQIEINSCKECKHFTITNVSSTDGWDRGEDWHCKKADRQIEPFVEWHENPKIPEWCPCALPE